MPAVFVSIGSNIDPTRNIVSAVGALRAAWTGVVLSKVYRGPAVGFVGDDFFNLVAGFDASQPPGRVIDILRCIEQRHGRRPGQRGFQSRTLDLDLLLYGQMVRHDDLFDVPRAEIERCAYVLRPLADIAGERRHPEHGRRLIDLWKNFDGAGHTQAVALAL